VSAVAPVWELVRLHAIPPRPVRELPPLLVGGPPVVWRDLLARDLKARAVPAWEMPAQQHAPELPVEPALVAQLPA
jgi:hypothetical protein